MLRHPPRACIGLLGFFNWLALLHGGVLHFELLPVVVLDEGGTATVKGIEIVEQMLADTVIQRRILPLFAVPLLQQRLGQLPIVDWTRVLCRALIACLDIGKPRLDPVRADGVVTLPCLSIALKLVHVLAFFGVSLGWRHAE